ncbi:hypothetical protein [Methylotenera mobilis]|uniref:Uncharacterized protein n=1 Tax=Methylotenera mobilis (strain JLW8 / ATCC BAA-1282 / DSM 17540) TaxID=583345 RepID=C6WXL9_METML|nr:hypothetical protein [Methylotenera mobilis]ACT48668.1 hypothetical protein Mmol_1764 [Methylotenera mobilis JLW8]
MSIFSRFWLVIALLVNGIHLLHAEPKTQCCAMLPSSLAAKDGSSLANSGSASFDATNLSSLLIAQSLVCGAVHFSAHQITKTQRGVRCIPIVGVLS